MVSAGGAADKGVGCKTGGNLGKADELESSTLLFLATGREAKGVRSSSSDSTCPSGVRGHFCEDPADEGLAVASSTASSSSLPAPGGDECVASATLSEEAADPSGSKGDSPSGTGG